MHNTTQCRVDFGYHIYLVTNYKIKIKIYLK